MGKSNKHNNTKTKVRHVLLLVSLCCFPFLMITGCGFTGCFKCTNCGDDSNRILTCASGTDNNGVKYTSCVGPAGILGFGCNSKCWPTECVKVKKGLGSSEISGCVTYYNETGCIDKTAVKSNGKYSDSVNCLFISCGASEYVETVTDTTKAEEGTSCFGCSLKDERAVTPKNYNSSMPRSFQKGFWSSSD